MNFKKTLSVLVLLLIFIPSCFASDDTPTIYKDDITNLYGLKNNSGDIILKPTYDFINTFVNDVSIVKKNERTGAIDYKGNLIVPLDYDNLSLFREHNALALKNGKFGLISKDNKLVVDFIWDKVDIVNGNPSYQTFMYKKGNSYGVANFDGKTLLGPINTKLMHLSDTRVSFIDNGLLGLMDFDGKVVLSANYNAIYNAGLNYIVADDEMLKFISPNGYSISDDFTTITPINDDLYFVSKSGEANYALYSSFSKKTSDYIYKSFVPNKDASYSIVINNDNRYGLVDSNGEIIVEASNDFIKELDNFYLCSLDKKFALYNKQTKKISEYRYENISDFKKIGDLNLAIISTNGRYGIIREDSSYLVAPYYDYIDKFKNNYALIYKNDKVGLIDSSGKIIVDTKYDSIKTYDNNYIVVKLDGKFGYIKDDGTTAIAPKFDKADKFDKFGYAVVEIDGKKALIRKNGNYVLQPIYEQIEVIDSDLIKVQDYDSKQYGIINSNNETIIKTIFDQIRSFDNNDVTAIKVSNKYALVNKDGEFITKFDFDHIGMFKNGLAPIKIGNKSGFINILGVYSLK